jgi:thiamine-monophosphate kinase
MTPLRGEFAFIDLLAKSVAGTPEALGLADDGGVLWLGDGRKLVVVADMLQAGVHVMENATAAQLTSKALRANLSDLAAMGAEPAFFLNTLCWPEAPDDAQMQALADMLVREQNRFGAALIGGDTILGQGPLTVSVTALGWANGPLLRRAGAKVGDEVWVSGTIGDGWLGLGVAQQNITDLPDADARFLRERYEYPSPRLALGVRLAPLAHCALDVSDGLIADAGHLAAAGGVQLCLDPQRVPCSPAARHWLSSQENRPQALEQLMSGGDDYELLFCADSTDHAVIMAIGSELDLPLQCIGQVLEGHGVMLGELKTELHHPQTSGFTHF